MPKNIKLIGLDLDRTMLNEKKEVTPQVSRAVGAAIKAGITVLPATGRSLNVIPNAVLQVPGIRYALTSNGAKVYDLEENIEIYANCFSKQDLKKILSVCNSHDVMLSVFLNGCAYMEPFDFENDSKHFEPEIIAYMRKSRDIVTNLNELIEEADDFEKVSVVFKTMDERARAWRAFEELGICTVTSSMRTNIELNAIGCDKGVALLALAKHLGIKRDEVMAIGDSSNDLEMLKAVGYAVAMADSEDCILNAAHSVTGTCEEDGVAMAIERVIDSFDNE